MASTNDTDRISNTEDIIDSRDVIARIEALEGTDEPTDDEREELAALKALTEQAEGSCSEWRDGAGLIRDSYFQTYAREFAEDIGAIGDDTRWPATHIDWERAAEDLQQDYTSVEFDGVDYWVR